VVKTESSVAGGSVMEDGGHRPVGRHRLWIDRVHGAADQKGLQRGEVQEVAVAARWLVVHVCRACFGVEVAPTL
jgi:hypothetical protein